jgi:hypothetical protein
MAQRTGRRHSFISYNFVFRRLFDLLGCSHLGADFPPLKSKRKREDIISIWLTLIRYLRWPYINSDARLFGAAHAIDIFGLDGRSEAQPAKNPKHSHHRLRQPVARSPSPPHTRGEDDPVVPDVRISLCGASPGWDSGASDGDNSGVGLGEFQFLD